MKNILCVCNPKGGTAKTTTAISIAQCFAALECDVLFVDIDDLGIPSKYFLDILNLYESASDETSNSSEHKDLIHKSWNKKIDIIPRHKIESFYLAYPIEDHNPLNETIVASAANYDLIIIDTSRLDPKFEIAVSKNLLITISDDMSVEGINYLLNTWENLEDADQLSTQIVGILLTISNRKSYRSHCLKNYLANYFGDRVIETIIPRNEMIQKSILHKEPIFRPQAGPSPAAIAYWEATKELINKWNFE